MPLAVLWPLTVEWYGDRLDPDFRPRPVEELQALLDGVGLVDEFWRLRR